MFGALHVALGALVLSFAQTPAKQEAMTFSMKTGEVCQGLSQEECCAQMLDFAGFKAHIGLFPPTRGNAALEKAVARYAGPKGNLRFPYDEPLPLALIARIVRHKVRQDAERAAVRRVNKKSRVRKKQ